MNLGSSVFFDRFELRPSERLLLAEGKAVSLGARAFDVLLTLIERRDRVVSKNELLDLGWPGLVVEENNLSVQISALRRVLGAAAIATVPGRGYRFTAAIATPQAPTEASSTPTAGSIIRRLSTVGFADIAHWERLQQSDPARALAAWKTVRTSLIDKLVPAYGGQVRDASALGVLVEFPSAVEAVRWALDLQDQLVSDQDCRHMALQMRVSLGVDDAIVEEGRLAGEGVQAIARRLALAAAGQILVDSIVRALTCHRLSLRYERLPSPIASEEDSVDVGYLLLRAREHSFPSVPSLRWSSRPSLAVLPFDVEDGATDPYFGDGITEEIISTLSLNRGLIVIARASTLHYRQSVRRPESIAAELGVRYLLSGSVRRHQNSLRISTELMDAESRRAIWAERFEGASEELFSFQTRIAASIAAAVDPRVQEAEIARVATFPTESLTAYDCVLRGLSVLNSFRSGHFDMAGTYFRRAIDIDPNYAQAHAHLAWWHNLRFGEGRSIEMDEDVIAAERLSSRAVELDPRDAWALSIAGHIQSFVRRNFKVAMEMFDQALYINPSCATAWSRSGTTLAYIGQGEQALDRVRNAMRLSPFDTQAFAFCTTNGTASIVAGRPDEAVAWLGKARRLNPGYRAAQRMLVAALALNGELEEARAEAQEFLEHVPGFSIAAFGARYPLSEPHLGKVISAMRIAQLPD